MATETATLPRYEPINLDKPAIPIIDHVITDQQLNDVVVDSKPNLINLAKVHKLLTDSHSVKLQDRHIKALQKVIRQYQRGFPIKDILTVYKIVNVCAERVLDNPLYEEPLISFIHLCGLPYLKEKTSDDINYKEITVESISHLGYLMRVPIIRVRKEICRTLVKFYTQEPDSAVVDVELYKPTNLTQKQTAISNSDIAETMVKSLSLLDDDEQLMEDVLVVLECLSKNSGKVCNQMLSVNAAFNICSQLTRFDPAGKSLFISVNILWNLLEFGDSHEAANQLANVVCINQLRDSFLYQLTQGYSHYHRQLRNDFLTLANLVASKCPNAPFMETGFAKQLCIFATFQEVKCHSILVKHLKLDVNAEDFELKKNLFTILVQLSSDPSVIPILYETNVVLALFSYVRENETVVARRDWSPAQFEELQLLAMSSLGILCPAMLSDYMACQGSTRILILLEWCVSLDEYGGHGNSYHGSGGRGNKRAQMRQCVRLLRSIVSTADVLVIQDLVDQGAVHNVTDILVNAVASEANDDAIDIEMQTDMLMILSYMCEDDPHNKELFGINAVNVVISYLKMDPKLINGGLGHHKLLITAIDTVWSCIVGCSMNEEQFLAKQGICLLLDLLEYVPKGMQNTALGCLLDLCDNPKTVDHLMVWRGKKQINLVNLMCEMWRVIEFEIGVVRDYIGAIDDPHDPLLTSSQKDEGVIPLPASYQSASIVDVSENTRSKIYALLSKIGFSEFAGLPVEDYITLTLIEKYLDLKMGQVWGEIREELAIENIRPITPDMQALEAIAHAVTGRNTLLNMTQVELHQAHTQKELAEESQYYRQITENNKQKEKAISDFQDFVYRTSNYAYLKDAKYSQKLAIDGSRVPVDKTTKRGIYHETDVPRNEVTAFSGVALHVDSTPVSITGGYMAQYDSTTGNRSPRNYEHHPSHELSTVS